MQVWPDLGFDIINKSRTKMGISAAPGTNRLEFGLCRRDSPNAPENTERLPPILQSSPEAHAPPGVPTACLASIDLHLQYAYCPGMQEPETQIVEPLRYKHRDETELPLGTYSMEYTHSIGKLAVATFVLSTKQESVLPLDQPFKTGGSRHVEPARQKPQNETIEQLSLQFLDLFDFGLQKLILPGVIRNHRIKVVGKNKLQNLSVLAPAVLNLEYREVSTSWCTLTRKMKTNRSSGNETAGCIPVHNQQVTHIDARKQQQPYHSEQIVQYIEGVNRPWRIFDIKHLT
jgi:hypothetical protein